MDRPKMEKHLVTLEFRYFDAPRFEVDCASRSNKITIGVYDDFDAACINGNRTLMQLESKFKLHVFPSGREASRERFSKNGGCFGSKKDLITNLAYLKTPFEFYAKITTLKYDPVEESINEVLDAIKRHKKYVAERDDCST